MATSTVDPDTLLAIDIGSVHTRAVLFDVVEGRYQVVAVGVAPSTVQAPWHDLREGVTRALEQIQALTGRDLLDEQAQLIVPTQADGSGVDRVAVTLSAGKPLALLCLGALPSLSLRSVCRLAESTYSRVVHRFHLNDRLGLERRLEIIARAQPEVILVGGGTDGGAEQSVLRLIEAVALGASLLPPQRKPVVLYTGNQALVPQVKRLLEPLTELVVSPNVRPSVDTERLPLAHDALVQAFRGVRRRQLPGLDELYHAAQGNLYPTATAFGRMIRFLSRLYEPQRGVLGIDLGAGATTLAAAWGGELTLRVDTSLGLGEPLPRLVEEIPLPRLAHWLPNETLTEDDLGNYLYNKALFPESLPADARELALEQALARQILRTAMERAYPDFPREVWQPERRTPGFDLILLSGGVLTQTTRLDEVALVALDGIQPVGISTLVLDQNHLLPALGAAASVNPYLSVQVLESPHFVPLATVVAPVWQGRPGGRVLSAHLEAPGGQEADLDLEAGALEVLPLAPGQRGRLTLRLHGGAHLGRGGRRTLQLEVTGSRLGLIFDGRGRPLAPPAEAAQRQQWHRRWLQRLGV